ncbi:T9SS type B sorting domain-containing protein [Pareuzebyella sediminis]|uniref:T9SS type B sorting domain-containing protein n=1 Tax=Pareuzebyella sediminis TaxID=2607998 RepID=UPI0011EF1C58|nr:T9SS type B sorting domain-containing protein [Pareuzebyella sediminis]
MNKKNIPSYYKYLLLFGFLCAFYNSYSQEVAPFTPRLNGGNIEIRGDIEFVGNNILNRASESNPAQANDPYNGTANNNSLWMEYIDIDGDPSTFSSSSAELNISDPSCSQVRYAGLYWAATYPNERSTNGGAPFSGTPRIEDWFNIKFRVPGGSYVDLTADTAADPVGQEDDIIYDGYDYTNINNSFKDSPYICYKNVTDLVRSNTNPNGEYTVANVRATKGRRQGSSSAGWVMVIIYENPNESGKFISTFDGYAGMSSAAGNVDVAVNGFRTLPNPFPVRARIGVAALEGDRGITNDRFFLRANSSGSFTNLSTGLNPANNFFNSTITNDGNEVPTRTPYGTNTLGTDIDLFTLNNPLNSVLPNSESGAILRFTSTGDGYGSFLAVFAVEIIEPNIVLEKKVEDISGNDITGQGVHLGQLLDYVLSFENIGNDDATNYTIRDVLPINVTLDESNITMPPGTTYVYNEALREVIFTIPDYLVNQGDPIAQIRMRVQVAENCFDFIDACSDLIQNLAYSTYRGAINSNQITDDPSVTDFDNCGFIVPGATNFLLDDLSDCSFSRTVQLCGDSVVLDAGDNFDDYIWKRDDNGNGVFDATDTTITDGDPDNDPSTMTVSQEGTYIVDKIVADPCKGFKEIMVVERFGSDRTNPIIEYYNTINNDADPTNDIQGEIVQCSVDGDLLPKIFLCGSNDEQPIQINILDAQSMSWEKLDEASCDAAPDDCANKNLTCVWNQVATGSDYTANTAGKYRLVINYQNGCFNRYYFDVFQNTLDIQYNKTDMLCGNDGNITITNLGSNYGYQLVNVSTNSIIVPFSANGGPSFDIAGNGSYRVDVVQLDGSGNPIDGACIFSTPDIGILNRIFNVDVEKTDASCTGFGSITLSALNAVGQYYYEVSQGGNTVDTFGPSDDNTYTFTNLNPGIYDYMVTTDDGCAETGQVEIIDNTDLAIEARVSQHITCKEGNILMSSDGGKTPHTYAIWSYTDDNGVSVTSYNNPSEIPASEYQTSQIFDIYDPGFYTFIVVDRNNCVAFSNTVEIEFRPAAEYDPTSVTDVLCFGDATGAIQFNLVDDNGYQLTYYLFDGTTFDEDNYDYTNAIATNASGNFPGLPAGDYAVVINQRKGSASCDYFEYHTISTPSTGLDATSVLIQEYTCTQDAIIEAQNVTGGTAPYSYSIDGINFTPDSTPNANRFENLIDGTYTITVRDNAGCTFLTDPITIAPLNEPSDLTFMATQPLCPALTSDVTVSVLDGNAPFTYEITAPAANVVNNGNNAVFSGLSAGTYTFRVSDAKGCSISESYTIAPTIPLTVNGQLDNNVTCFGLSDGAITFTVSDFTMSYDYEITGPTTVSVNAETSNTIPLSGLSAGTYSITVTDNDTNCTDTTSITVSAPPSALVISNLDVTDITCSATGTNPGSVVITASDGWGGFEYELEDPSGAVTGPQPTNSFTGLTDTSGNYIVTVRDAGGCEVTQTFALTPLVSPNLDVSANSLCYDSTTGLTLTANVVSGGVAPFQYRLNGGSYQSNTSFTGLGPGSYTVEVIDGKNCTGSASIDVFPTLAASASLIKDLDCSATPDAEINVTITGGNPSFTYEVFRDGSSIQAAVAAPSNPFSYFTTTAGTYEFVITDSESCTVTTNQVAVTANTPPTVNEISTDPLCNSSTDGIAELQISGGTPPYQIVFDGSAPSAQATYTGLSAGTYAYSVTDAKGCVVTDDITLNAPPVLLPGTIDVVQDYRCDNTSAVLQVINYGGGTPGYTFSIDGINFQASDTFNTNITAGTYTITVRDSNGCIAQTPAVTIDSLDPPTDLNFAQTSPVCPAVVSDVTVTVTGGTAPLMYEIIAPAASVVNNGGNNLFSGLTPGTYTFQVTDDRGCTILENYTVADIPRVSVLSQLTGNVSCFGLSDGEFTFTVTDFVSTYSYTVENSSATIVQSQTNINLTVPVAVTGLVADTYTVTITDDTTNCTDTSVVTVDGPAAALGFSFTNTPVTCIENATISVSATGGWGSYEYQLENTVGPAIVYPYQGSSTFTNVPSGSYTIYVRDAGGCVVDRPIIIDPAETPTIAVSASSDYCFDGTDQAMLLIDVTDGVAPYSYSINGGALTSSGGSPISISNLIPGTYNIQVTDAYGCVSNVITGTIEPQLTASAIVSKALDCTASPDAIIDVAIANGYTPYAAYEVSSDAGASWSLPTAIVGSGFSYTTPSAGTYLFRVTDNRGCAVSAQAVIEPIDSPDITSIVQTADILCNGDAGASIQINLDNTRGVAPYAISVVNTTTSTNYGSQTSGLPAGTYEVTVTDAKSCSDMEVIVIGEPDPITYNINLMPITCDTSSGTNPGSITVENVTGGTLGFTYYLTGNNGYSASQVEPTGGDYTFTILEFGIYEVDVVDANGCSVVTTNIIASPPDDLDIDVSTATADCVTGGTAVVTVTTAILGTNYEFGILDSFGVPYASTYFPPDVSNGPTRTFTGLTPGITYTFVVHDITTNCYYFETAAAPIDSPSNLTATLDAVNNITCTGSADGNVSFTFDNYAGDATSVDYEIFNSQSNLTTGITGSSAVNPPGVGTGVSVSNLGPLPYGVYYILFTEVGGTFAGCTSASAQFTITESTNLLQVTAALERNDNCYTNAGQVSAVGQFGTAPYEYQIALATDPAPTAATWSGGSTNVFNVEGGNYTVYIKDANNCIQSDGVVVPTDPSSEISVVAADQCTADEGTFSATITLDVGGIAPYSIRVDGAAPQAAPALANAGDTMIVTGLSSGAHTFEILDANGCGELENITLFAPLTVLANLTADEFCNPANSGEVTVTANGGSGTYSYTQITPAGPTNASGIFIGLTHSINYTFEVEDTVTNCTAQVSITLPAPSVPAFSLEATDVSCFGGSDGTITVTLAPGNIDVPYLYSLDGGTTTQASNVFTGLTQGTYNVTVVSSKGCDDTQSIDIAEPSQLDISASASAFSCDDSASTITVTVNNDGLGNPSGTGPYVYSFDNGANYQASNSYQVPFGSPDINVVVRDANGCTDSETVPIPVVQQVTASINQIQAIDCNNGAEIIEIVAANGSGSYIYTELPSGAVIADPTNITINQPGTYAYEITDTVTNCSVTVEHVVAPFDLIDATATVISDATCSESADGTIEVTITGYTGTFNYQVLDNFGGFIAGASGADNATSDPYTFGVPTSLPAGTYTVQITETAYPQCVAETNTVTVDAPEPISLQLVDNVNANCNEANAIVTVQATGGTAPYTYGATISGAGIPGSFPFDATVELDPAVSLDWDIYARDSNGCIIAAPLAVTVGADTLPDITLALDDKCADEGSFSITVSLDATNNGISPYTMSINGSAFQSILGFPYTYTNLTSGIYAIEIRDANGCGEVENITIDPELRITADVVSQPSCNTNDGIIQYTVIGGDASNAVSLLNASTMADTGLTPTGNQFTGVPFGNYIVRVTDTPITATSCTADAPVSLEEPTPVTLLASDKTDVSCPGASDGTITVNLAPPSVGVNDNPPYTFEITDGSTTITQLSNLFTGLAAGVYDITVTSNRNCIATDQVTIIEPIALDANVTNVVPFACDMNNAEQVAQIEITITPGTGTPDYFYRVNGGSFLPTGGTVFTYDVLNAGTYDFEIRDANGCTFLLPTQTIDPINSFVPTVSQVASITCAGPEEVLITVADDGNPHVYTFELLPIGNPNGVQTASTNTTANYNLTAVGSYTFRITDTATGCYVDTAPYEILPYDLIDVVATPTSSVTCFGDSNGIVEINITGYSGSYDYEVLTQAGASVQTGSGNTSTNPMAITGLSGGNYFVRVTETTAPGCFEDSNTITIASPDMPLVADATPVGSATCTDDQGEILVDVTGGYGPYDIVLNNTTSGQTYTANNVQAMLFTGLSSGNYDVTVTDSGGCVATDTEVLATPTPITANAIPLVTDLSCYDNTDGTVTAVVTGGGSGSYEYRLNYYDAAGATIEFSSGQQSSSTFTGLGEGVYSVTVVDGWNCDVETNQVRINEPSEVTSSLTQTSAMTCATEAELLLTASGGTGPYQYSTDNLNFVPMSGGNTHTFNIAAGNEGTYQYYVIDAQGCAANVSNSVSIEAIPELILYVDNSSAVINCTGENTAIIYADAEGGLGNYNYELYNAYNGTALNAADRIAGPQTSGTFADLTAGTYYVNVTSGDCMAPPQEVIITEPLPLTYTDSVSNVTCVGENDGSISVTLEGGSGGYQYAISPRLDKFDTENVFDELPGSPTGITYTVIAQDQNGCFIELQYTIFEPEPLVATVVTTPETCEEDLDGTITIEITGGTAPFRTSLNNLDDFEQDRLIYTGLAPGAYFVYVRDANDCEYVVPAVVDQGVNLNAEVTPVYGCNDTIPNNYVNIILEDETIAGDVMYALDSTDPLDMQLNPYFRDMTPGAHFVTVASSSGCIKTYDFEIMDFEPLTLTLQQNNINEITAIAQGGREAYTFYFGDIDNGPDNTFVINRTDTYEVTVVDENGCEALASIYIEFIDIEIPNFFTPNGDNENDFWKPRNIQQFPEILIKIYDRYGRVVAHISQDHTGWDGKYNEKELPSGDYWYVIQLNGENDEREFFGHFTLYR